MRPEANVTVIYKQCVTLCNPKMYPYTKFRIPTYTNIGDVLEGKVKLTLKQYRTLAPHHVFMI